MEHLSTKAFFGQNIRPDCFPSSSECEIAALDEISIKQYPIRIMVKSAISLKSASGWTRRKLSDVWFMSRRVRPIRASFNVLCRRGIFF
ncbi:hypothetical protein JMJ77_0000098 [Colletotrichum scovillei]|uniref:Uncharacterized protein n=1 Tax=Colletotrichum scovillei TaxID=1209932 RepID=A0A9P7UJX3_9PEZI|nr:hypothetical protein JMJ77_0000098 [Colletotrichum scovillei]KAG7071299.1 hypothetical protein JMJ76_0004172 [Colletotrichum scovillei]KAG7079587.1 hypothetical protein JMJ78_0006693 [Colletotrichum scovillei]